MESIIGIIGVLWIVVFVVVAVIVLCFFNLCNTVGHIRSHLRKILDRLNEMK